MIAAISLIEQTVPPSRLTEGIGDPADRRGRGHRPGRRARRPGRRRARRVRRRTSSGCAPGSLAVVGRHRRPAPGRSIGSPREHLDELVAVWRRHPRRVRPRRPTPTRWSTRGTPGAGRRGTGQDGRHRPQLHRIAAPDGRMLRPDAADRRSPRSTGTRMTVTARPARRCTCSTPSCEGLGLALHNMGDIDRADPGRRDLHRHPRHRRRRGRPVRAGGRPRAGHRRPATLRPGRRPRGERRPPRRGPGRPRRARHPHHGHVPGGAGLRAGGASRSRCRWEEVLDGFDELADGNEHVDMYWFPHTDRMLTKRNNRTGDRPRAGRSRAGAPTSTTSCSPNTVVRRCSTGSATGAPALIPRLARLGARAARARTYTDDPAPGVHRRRAGWSSARWSTPSRVRSACTALPEAAGPDREAGWRISFPVEIRHAPADDIWLSTAHDRASVYLAFHVNARADHTRVLRGVEQILGRTTDGRTGASCTPARPRTWRRRTRGSATSSRCATGSTRSGCSPTATSPGAGRLSLRRRSAPIPAWRTLAVPLDAAR